jgi:hypothetical protein
VVKTETSRTSILLSVDDNAHGRRDRARERIEDLNKYEKVPASIETANIKERENISSTSSSGQKEEKSDIYNRETHETAIQTAIMKWFREQSDIRRKTDNGKLKCFDLNKKHKSKKIIRCSICKE